jgi:hypothetical protein
VLATVREEVRSLTTSFGAALQRSWTLKPGALMDASLAFSVAGAEESSGETVRWFARRRNGDGVDVTALRRLDAGPDGERWNVTSIRLPAWAPKLAEVLEQELVR